MFATDQCPTNACVHVLLCRYDPIYGARPVKRALQRELQTLLAKALLRGQYGEDDVVIVSVGRGAGLLGDEEELKLTKAPRPVETATTVEAAETEAAAEAAASAGTGETASAAPKGAPAPGAVADSCSTSVGQGVPVPGPAALADGQGEGSVVQDPLGLGAGLPPKSGANGHVVSYKGEANGHLSYD